MDEFLKRAKMSDQRFHIVEVNYILKVYQHWLIGTTVQFKHNGLDILLFIPHGESIIYVEKAVKNIVKNCVQYFKLEIGDFRFVRDLYSTNEIQRENGSIFISMRRSPDRSIVSNVNFINGGEYESNVGTNLQCVDVIRDTCSKFRGFLVRGQYYNTIIAAHNVQGSVKRLQSNIDVYLITYDIIALMNETHAYLELGHDIIKSISLFRKSARRIRKFRRDERMTKTVCTNEYHIVEQQTYLKKLINKSLSCHELEYDSEKHFIIYQDPTHSFHTKSHRAFRAKAKEKRLRKDQMLNEKEKRWLQKKRFKKKIERFKRTRCARCQGINSDGKNKKCKQCQQVYYCSKRCQWRHWRLVHKSVCTLHASE